MQRTYAEIEKELSALRAVRTEFDDDASGHDRQIDAQIRVLEGRMDSEAVCAGFEEAEDDDPDTYCAAHDAEGWLRKVDYLAATTPELADRSLALHDASMAAGWRELASERVAA